jgi:hypothetical protein
LEYPESDADTAQSHADPRGFRYGGAANDSELTLPLASSAPFKDPTAACWHVHLELRPEELVALHRLGLTKGAIAWREGMPEWQPLKDAESSPRGSDVDASDIVTGSDGNSAASDWSDAITVASDRELSEPLPPALGSAPETAGRLPERPRRATLPPTSPLFAAGGRPHVAEVSATPRNTGTISTFPPPPARGTAGVSSFPPPPAPHPRDPGAIRSSAGIPTIMVGGAPGSMPPPRLPAAPPLPTFATADAGLGAFATQPIASFPPTSAVFEPTGVSSSPRRRALWFGAIGLALLSVMVGSLMSGVFTSVRAEAPPGAEATKASVARAEVTAPSNVKQNDSGGPAPISIEQLPLAAAAAAAAKAEAPASGSVNNAAAAFGTPAARGDSASAPAAAAAAAVDPVEPVESRASGGGPDLKAIAKAVSAAARSSASCGDSPQSGKVAITFSPSGAVRSVQMESPFAERDVGSCVLRAMGRAKVSPFEGDPVVVKKSVTW